MKPLLLLVLLAVSQVKPLTGCTTEDNRPCVPSARRSVPTPKMETDMPGTRTSLPGPAQTRSGPFNRQAGQSSEDFRIAAYRMLTRKLSRLELAASFPTPYELLLMGPDTVPLSVNKNGQVLMAAARFGKGKMVVLGHESYLQDATFKDLLLNAVSWLKPTTTSTVGLYTKFTTLASLLQGAGEKVLASDTWSSTTGVFCMDTSTDAQANDLINFVQSGGGLLIAGDASAWTGADVLTKATGNKIASVAGVYFTNQLATLSGAITFPEIPPQYRVYVSDLGDFKNDVASIISNVGTFTTQYFTKLLVHGRLAFPIMYGKERGIISAGAYYGKGRVVVLPSAEVENNGVLVANAIKWLRGNQQGKIAMNPNLMDLDPLQNIVTRAGLTPVVTTLMNAAGIDVYVTDTNEETERDLIDAFVAKGGGLLISGDSYFWREKNPTLNVIENLPMNRVINRFGISFTGAVGFDRWTKSDTSFSRTTPYDIRRFVADLLATGNLNVPAEHHKQLVDDSRELMQIKKSATYQLSQLCYSLAKGLTSSKLNPPSLTNIVSDAQEKLFWRIHAYAPYSINIVTVNGTATTGNPWRSTGLYAKPEQAINFIVPKVAVGSRLQIHFGCQSDNLFRADNKLQRYPEMIPYSYRIDSEYFTLSSKFGGLIYIKVRSASSLGNLEFVVENADLAPYFRDGVTDPNDWENTVRAYPAPWVEIEAKNIIHTFPSQYVRNVTGATIVNTVQMWNRAMDASAKLAARSFLNPERFVLETQISIGALHSGYPMMAYEWRGPYLANATRMIEERYFWGFFHELGHNLQQRVWNFPFSSEITNNLWPVYVGEEVFGVSRADAWGNNLKPWYRQKVMSDYLKSTDPLNGSLGDTYVRNLIMYLYLQEGFGWQPFIDVIGKYQSMLDLSLDDTGRLNLWVKMFSLQVNRNLVPYFKRLKWPVTQQVESELSALPVWAENPLNAFP